MNLAIRDIRRHLARFVGTAVGLGLLLAVVVSMQGIYAGLVDDATILTRAMKADLWVVQHGTHGPFAEASRLDPSVTQRLSSMPGAASVRDYTYQLVQRRTHHEMIRLAVVGLSWPDDRGQSLPLIAGRPLNQSSSELIADVSLGLTIGETLMLADEPYRVVGLTKNTVTSSGDAATFVTVRDAQLIALDQPDEAVRNERERALERLRSTDLGRGRPELEQLITDPRWRAPVVAAPSLNAVLVSVAPGADPAAVKSSIEQFGDLTVHSTEEEQDLLLQGVVQRAKMQLGLFSVILSITASVILMMVLYTMTLEKTHDLAILKLMGARRIDLMALVLQESWILGGIAYVVAVVLGQALYPHFPRRVVLTPEVLWGTPIAVLLLTTLASVLGVVRATRVDAGKVLEG